MITKEARLDCKAIAEDAKKSLPTCAKWCFTIADFCREYSGGPGYPLVKELSDFENVFRTTAQRLLGQGFIEAVIKAQTAPPLVPIPYLKVALIKAQKLGNKIIDGFCKLIPASKIHTFSSKDKRRLVVQAETLLREGRDAAKTLSPSEFAVVIGMLDVRVVMFILELAAEFRTDQLKLCESLTSIGEAIVSHVSPNMFDALASL